MDLPQTAPGVPTPGIDPTVIELQEMASVADIFSWLGTDDDAKNALFVALGTKTLKVRDIVYIKAKDWDDAIHGITVITEGKDPRELNPIESGHMSQLRRIARLRVGLPAVEVIPVKLGIGGGGVVAESGLSLDQGGDGMATPLASPRTLSTEPRLKLSVILDSSLDSDLVRLPHIKIRGLFNKYAERRGAEPAEDVEPTTEQISAVSQVVDADMVPYADFSLWGPHGRRLVGKLSYLAWTFQPDGTWHRRELPGPPTFEHWWSSFRVLRTAYLLLDVAAPEILDNYGEMLRGFHALYGPSAWFIIYTADIRMRSEQFERIRRYAERDHDNALAASSPSSFDVAKPWHSVFRSAISDKIWWDENLHRPAMLYLT